jgi:hypothetical protein
MRFQKLPELKPVLFRTGGVAALITIFSCSSFAQGGLPQRQVRPREIPGAMIPAPKQPTGPSSMKLRVEEGIVTAEIRNTPLQKVLEEFAARTGIVFEVQTQEDPPLSISLFRVGLREAIQRIVGERDSLYYYSSGAETALPQLVRVFPRGNIPLQPSLRYIGTGSVTKSGSDVIESPDEALKVLAESLDVDARQRAVEVLVNSRNELAYEALLVIVNDPAPEIRVAAIEGFASLGARPALPVIVKALKDSHPGVRQSAITAIALLGDAENVKDLRRLGKDPDANVAAAAEVAIRKLSMRVP